MKMHVFYLMYDMFSIFSTKIYRELLTLIGNQDAITVGITGGVNYEPQ